MLPIHDCVLYQKDGQLFLSARLLAFVYRKCTTLKKHNPNFSTYSFCTQYPQKSATYPHFYSSKLLKNSILFVSQCVRKLQIKQKTKAGSANNILKYILISVILQKRLHKSPISISTDTMENKKWR